MFYYFLAMPDGKFRTVYKLGGEKEFNFFIKPYSLQKGLYRVDFTNSMMTKWDIRENFDQVFFYFVFIWLFVFEDHVSCISVL